MMTSVFKLGVVYVDYVLREMDDRLCKFFGKKSAQANRSNK